MPTLRIGTSAGTRLDERDELDATDVVAVRRNVWLSGVVAGLAALIGIAYLLRGSPLGLVLGVVLLVVAALNGAAMLSARIPVLVADEHGIRLRVGLAWRGFPWGSMRQVVVEHADSPLREGRLVVVPRDPGSALDHLGGLGRLHLRWNQLWYGAALSVPLGMTTRTDSGDLGSDLAVLANGRSDVVHLRGRQLAQLDDVVAPQRPEPETVEEAPVPFADLIDASIHPQEPAVSEPVETMAEPIATVESAVVEEPAAVEPVEPVIDELPEPVVERLPEPVAPVRPLNHPARVEVRLDSPAMPSPAADPEEVLAGLVPAQRGPEEIMPIEVEHPDLEHAEAWEEVAVEIEADDLSVRAPEPVIGPKIVHAREMLDMSIDELSQRTRIRPHVIEAIEVDDFGPCGGDFYARGHLTAIARVLGLTVEQLLKEYDERYAGGPINARRVFEAELATGLSSGMRATRGGPQWTMLIAVVLCLTLVWAVARLLSGSPEQVAAPPVSSGDVAGLAANRQPITSPLMKTTPMTVTAAHAGTHVVVRDRTGRILWSGDLRMGRHRQVVGLAPFKVAADNAGAVEVTVAGHGLGTIGTPGEAGAKRFG
jgi:cytoskeleton protein RodZ